MSRPKLDPIILGHNPFFGVDHLSQERGNEKAKKFEDTSRIIDVLKHCHGLGVRGMMMSTHPRAAGVCAGMREDQTFNDWRIYPLVPYIQKYVRGSNEKGLSNLIIDTLGQATLGQKLSILFRGSKGLLGKDVKQALTLLIDIEMLPFKGMPLGAVFLHDTLSDLALGMGMDSLLDLFRDHVEKTYNVPAAFVTKNLPLFRKRTDARGWKDTVVMASFNGTGFYMNPSREGCEKAIEAPGLDFVAMNTLASGQLSPDKAYSYLGKFNSVKSVVVGISRKEHAGQTVGAIREHLACARV